VENTKVGEGWWEGKKKWWSWMWHRHHTSVPSHLCGCDSLVTKRFSNSFLRLHEPCRLGFFN
jgi:hypothetical protein